MRVLHKKISVHLILLMVCLGFASAQEVLSPTQGTWANYQSLVLNLPENAEAYYSFTGENPLESGFAYDGPVLLELDGDVTINIAVVNGENNVKAYSISYTVALESNPEYIPLLENNAFVVINDASSLLLPENVRFSLGHTDTFYSGEELKIAGNMPFERNLPITIIDDDMQFRYVLQLGNKDSFTVENNFTSAISITDWNQISFLEEGPIVFSLDDEALRQTNSGEIFVDRSKDRVLKWQKYDGELSETFETIILPKKPEVIGMPSNPIVNQSVTLSLSDSRYMFSTKNKNNTVSNSSVYFVDTVSKDAFGFSDEIDICLDGIKHGSIQATFVIDKIAPSAPVFFASETSGYSRKNVELNVQAGDAVYYYILEPKLSKEGFMSDEHLSDIVSDFRDKSKYSLLEDTTLHLSNNSGLAQSYAVYAFSKDNAGNTSSITQFKTVIDPYNFYVENGSTSDSSFALGTVDKPFTSFEQLHNVLNSPHFKNVYINGVFTNLQSIELTQDIALFLTDTSRLLFASGELISVKNASVSIAGGNIEQSNPETTASLKSTLLHAQNSTIAIGNTEFLLSGGINSNCIVLENSSLQITDSGITVQSVAYASGIQSNNSVVLSQGSRFVLVSDTSIGMSLINTTAQVNNSSFTGIGPLTRALEFINSSYSVVNNIFVYENSELTKKVENTAIWKDEKTIQNVLADNTIQGFTTLVVN